MKIKYILIILILASFSFASICSAETENEENSEEKTASATRKVLTFDMGSGLPLEMIECPAGDFIMGCTDEEYIRYFTTKKTDQEWHNDTFGFSYNEKPHKVTISKPFYIGKYEVTQSQYEYIMGKKEYEFIMEDKDKVRGPNKPMEWVDYILIVSGRQEFDDRFYDAEKGELKKNPSKIESFLEKINTKFADQLPSGYKFDLPTEAQWEYACKAGTGKNFVDNIDEVAWYRGNSNTRYDDYIRTRDISLILVPHDVGQKKPNAWGIYDMHGNVREFCKDFYREYPTEAVTDPINEFKISFKSKEYDNWRTFWHSFSKPKFPRITIKGRYTEFDQRYGVVRGGSYNSGASTCRSTFRYPCGPGLNNVFEIGFRLALVSVDGTPATSSSSTTSNSDNTTKVSDTDKSSNSKSGSSSKSDSGSNQPQKHTSSQPQTQTPTEIGDADNSSGSKSDNDSSQPQNQTSNQPQTQNTTKIDDADNSSSSNSNNDSDKTQNQTSTQPQTQTPTKIDDADNSSSSKSDSDSSQPQNQTSSQPQTQPTKKTEIKVNTGNYDSSEYAPVELKPYKTHPHATVPEDVELEPDI